VAEVNREQQINALAVIMLAGGFNDKLIPDGVFGAEMRVAFDRVREVGGYRPEAVNAVICCLDVFGYGGGNLKPDGMSGKFLAKALDEAKAALSG